MRIPPKPIPPPPSRPALPTIKRFIIPQTIKLSHNGEVTPPPAFVDIRINAEMAPEWLDLQDGFDNLVQQYIENQPIILGDPNEARKVEFADNGSRWVECDHCFNDGMWIKQGENDKNVHCGNCGALLPIRDYFPPKENSNKYASSAVNVNVHSENEKLDGESVAPIIENCMFDIVRRYLKEG